MSVAVIGSSALMTGARTRSGRRRQNEGRGQRKQQSKCDSAHRGDDNQCQARRRVGERRRPPRALGLQQWSPPPSRTRIPTSPH